MRERGVGCIFDLLEDFVAEPEARQEPQVRLVVVRTGQADLPGVPVQDAARVALLSAEVGKIMILDHFTSGILNTKADHDLRLFYK